MIVVGLVAAHCLCHLGSLTLARAVARDKEFAVRRAWGPVTRVSFANSSLNAFCFRQVAHCSAPFSRAGRSLAGAHHLDGTEFGLRRLIPGHAHPWIAFWRSSAHPLLFGLLPALHSTRMSLSSAMKGGQSSQAGASLHSHARKWNRWVTSGALTRSSGGCGLLLRSFVKLVTLDIGFDRNNVLLVHTDLRTPKIPVDRQAPPTRRSKDA